MSEISFNLLDDPWIPCKTISNEYKLFSIKKLIFNASEIMEISSNNPLKTISLYRFLLAILHRNFGPKSRSDWNKLYLKGNFQEEVLLRYFDKWKKKFELFSNGNDRFYQINVKADLKKIPISKLNHALSSGNNSALFDHNWDSKVTPINPSEATQLLITYQNFALGGGKSTPFYYSDAPLASSLIVLVKGCNIFETLMLNLIRYDNDHPFSKSKVNMDIPFWEREKKVLCEKKQGRFPYGYLDYLTWQSRRIWLIPEKINGKIKVRYLYMLQGEKLDNTWTEDPQMTYRIEDNEKHPLYINNDRKVWRDTECLLQLNNGKSKVVSQIAIYWISKLAEDGVIPYSKSFNLEIYGLVKSRAKILSWHHSYIPLSLKFLQDQSLVEILKNFLNKCEDIEKILNKTIFFFGKSYLYPDKDKLNSNQLENVNNFISSYQIRIRYWSLVEKYFYKFINDLIRKKDMKSRLELINIYINTYIKREARRLWNIIYKTFKKNLRALKPLVNNSRYLHKRLNSVDIKISI